MAKRWKRYQPGVRVLPDKLEVPLKRKKPTVYACQINFGDLFHPEVPDSFVAEALGVAAVAGAQDGYFGDAGPCFVKASETREEIEPCEQYPNGCTRLGGPHTFVLVTKRPRRAAETLPRIREEISRAAHRWAHNRRDAGYLSDCISARENPCAPGRAGRLWPLPNVLVLASCWDQASVDDACRALAGAPIRWGLHLEPLLGPVKIPHYIPAKNPTWTPMIAMPSQASWIVVGGENGPGARPLHPDWVRAIRDRCEAAHVPFYLKSLGQGKGRLLDGREHNDVPWISIPGQLGIPGIEKDVNK
jgi:protein gp37